MNVNHSAYRKLVSRADATFATQETISRYPNCGCLYDLQKAFNSVEYLVCLDNPYEMGANGQIRYLMKSCDVGSCCVKVNENISRS